MNLNGNVSQESARKDLLQTIRKLLLGPVKEDEVLEKLSQGVEPVDFYLTGILWPRNIAIGAEEDEKTEGADSGEADSSDDMGAPLFSILKPSSIGLTCTIEGENTHFDVIVRGARYKPKRHTDLVEQAMAESPSESQSNDFTTETGGEEPPLGSTENGETSIFTDWERVPFSYRLTVKADESRQQWKTHNFITDDGNSVTDSDIAVHVRRRVRNGTLIVTATLLNATDRPDWQTLGPLCIYQSELELVSMNEDGNGRIIARPPDAAFPDDDTAVGNLLYRKFHEYAVGHGVAASWQEPVNNRVTVVKTEWIPNQPVYSVSRTGHEMLSPFVNRAPSPLAATFLSRESGRKEITSSLRELCEIYENWIDNKGQSIDTLPAIFRSTGLNNLDICRDTLSRIREGIDLIATDDLVFRAFCLANEAMNAQSTGRQRGDNAKPLVWFPFQLAFILLSLPSLVDPKNPARSIMDLLWFPTGGGKTEAYLGLTAFTIFYRRLKGFTQGSHVDVIMRYTLRLLTVQQFQRAAALICAADLIRQKKEDELGSEPISIGLYVGESATPNKLVGGRVSAKEKIDEERAGKEPSSTPRLLLNCPLCGADLNPFCYEVDVAIPELEITCPEVTCPSEQKPLPVYTVDEDIYRKKPSLLIGTVDKFAQLPRKEEQGQLLGRPGGTTPELIIQDELHLISGPLGTVTGLYEVCIDLLCSYGAERPKIVGSTATIGRARQQVRALFDRDVLQFPPPGLDAEDSFFAVTDYKAPNRLYAGISSAGRSPKFTLQALTAAALVASQFLREQNYDERAIDPYWTQLLYFNSLRELGGAKIMMQDDVPRSNKFYSARLETETRDIQGEPAELTSRIPSIKIPKILKELELPLYGDPFKGEPIDIIVASNMVSVGMDIPRLGMMIIQGQPKSTSEYIQATSRVGRGIPGLVLTAYNATRPRDMSHFEHFTHYHQTLYRRVEVTSVTPWSSRARDKALHAIFVSAVRHLVPGMAGRFGAAEFNPDDPLVPEIRDWIINRAVNSGSDFVSREDIKNELDAIIARWAQRARLYMGNKKFEYWATTRPLDHRPVNPHLMRGAEDPIVDSAVWATPNSMREVEPSAFYTELS